MIYDQSVYNDPTYNVTSVPTWKAQQAETAPPPAAKLSPRAKAGLGLGFACVAATGLFTWSHYESAQAATRVRQEQVALDAARVQLAQEQQTAALAKAGSQETAVQKARRLAVEACIAKTGSSYNGVSDCGDVFPAVGSPSMSDASSTTSTDSSNDSGSGSEVGLVVLGAIGVGWGVSWVKKKLPARQ